MTEMLDCVSITYSDNEVEKQQDISENHEDQFMDENGEDDSGLCSTGDDDSNGQRSEFDKSVHLEEMVVDEVEVELGQDDDDESISEDISVSANVSLLSPLGSNKNISARNSNYDAEEENSDYEDKEEFCLKPGLLQAEIREEPAKNSIFKYDFDNFDEPEEGNFYPLPICFDIEAPNIVHSSLPVNGSKQRQFLPLMHSLPDYSESSGQFDNQLDSLDEEFVNGIEDFGEYFRIKSNDFCNYCCESLDDKSKWTVHGECYFIRRQVESINKGDGPSTDQKWTFDCEFCPKVLSNRCDLQQHTAYHFPATMVCRKCGKRCSDHQGIKKHMQIHSGSNYSYSCSKCSAAYTQKAGLECHYDRVHADVADKTIECTFEECNKQFSNMSAMREHSRKHQWKDKPKRFKCPVEDCEWAFKTAWERKQHLRHNHPKARLSDEQLAQGYVGPKKHVATVVDLVDGQFVNLNN